MEVELTAIVFYKSSWQSQTCNNITTGNKWESAAATEMNLDSTTSTDIAPSGPANFNPSPTGISERFLTNYSTVWTSITTTSWTWRRWSRWCGRRRGGRRGPARSRCGRRLWSSWGRLIRRTTGWSTGRSSSCFIRSTDDFNDTIFWMLLGVDGLGCR